MMMKLDSAPSTKAPLVSVQTVRRRGTAGAIQLALSNCPEDQAGISEQFGKE
jgi:hypothetical protein